MLMTMLIAPSVTDLEHLLRMCEIELNFLDMAINSRQVLLYAYRFTLWY